MLRKDRAFFNSFLHRPPLSPAISASALVFTGHFFYGGALVTLSCASKTEPFS
jgi:hypothetical protein